MSQPHKEEPVYQLLSFYSREALEHAAWITGLIVATFTFMGVAVKNDNPSWGAGSFLVMAILGILMSYFSGRLIYFSKLVSILTTHDSLIDSTSPSMIHSAVIKTDGALDCLKNENSLNWIAYQFRSSFAKGSILISLTFGLNVGVGLYVLGWLVSNFK
jgi:hypothetical protein